MAGEEGGKQDDIDWLSAKLLVHQAGRPAGDQ